MKISIVQLCSKLDYRLNLEKVNFFSSLAKCQKTQAIFLPETFYSFGEGDRATPYLVEEGNEHFKNLQRMAREHSLFILGGSVAYKEQARITNRIINFDPQGKVIGFYDKQHLFQCRLKGKQIDESKIYHAGDQGKIIEIGDWKVGLSVCFDVRFPLLYQSYVKQGVNLLTISSAFTVPTGKAHWHTLLKARAIENQCYVVASAQWGQNNEQVKTYGHSLVVDPWGEILVDLGEGENFAVVDLDLKRVEEVRKSLPVDYYW
jgi:predicted amidohydrolase